MDQRILQIIQRHPELKSEFEDIYPELNESEDERIRKDIIALIEFGLTEGSAVSPGSSTTKKEALAWLERQKEDYSLFSEEQRKYMEKYISLDKVTLVKLLAERDKNTEEILRSFGNKEEQKSAEGTALQKAFINSKTDYPLEEKCDASDYAETVLPTSVPYGENEEEYKLHKIIEAAFIAGQKKEQKQGNEDRYMEGYMNGMSDALKEQKPVDDEEELEKCRKNPLYFFDKYVKIKMKPAECSEEEKERIRQNGRLDVCYNPEKYGLCHKTEWSKDYREEDIQTRFAFYTYKNDPSVLYLSNVFVEETSRNKGLGTRILRAAEKVAETFGIVTIRLKVKQDSPANAWYRKNGYEYVAFEDGYDWLEKNLEYMKPNKQEWSEVDNLIFDSILSVVEEWENNQSEEEKEYYGATPKSDWLKTKFKSLRIQSKEQWNEEDEKMLNRAIWYIENPAPMVVKDTILGEWLKSLKNRIQPSHWKPSKEQMKALSDAYAEASTFKIGDVLDSLCNDLQKLL